MLVLALDTATMAGSIALYRDGLLASCFINTKKTHSERLLPMVDFLLKGLELQLSDIDLITVVNGPGSFTGIRIGVTTAKTLAQMLKVPLVTVNTLETLAKALPVEDDLICPMLDARKKEIYTACYKRDSEGNLEQLTELKAVTPLEMLEYLKNRQEKVWFCGDGLAPYGEMMQEGLGERFRKVPAHLQLPYAAVSAELGLEKWQKAEEDQLLTAEPLYLRRSEAEIAWEKKNG